MPGRNLEHRQQGFHRTSSRTLAHTSGGRSSPISSAVSLTAVGSGSSPAETWPAHEMSKRPAQLSLCAARFCVDTLPSTDWGDAASQHCALSRRCCECSGVQKQCRSFCLQNELRCRLAEHPDVYCAVPAEKRLFVISRCIDFEVFAGIHVSYAACRPRDISGHAPVAVAVDRATRL